MELSIIIVNWNTRDYLRDCLMSISENIKEISFEVIVVDNKSSDGSADMVKNKFQHVKLIASDINTCFAKGNNIGYKIASGDYIAFLNPDTIVYPNTYETVITYLRTHSKVGAVSCKFLNPDGSFQREYYRRFPTLSIVFFCFTLFGAFIDKNFLKRKYESLYFYNDKNFDKIEKIDQPGATFIVIPKAILEKIGIFDEIFPIYFNDVDLCKRIWEAGFEIHLLNDVSITHYGGRGVNQFGWTVHIYFLTGCYRYFRKHNGIASAFLVIVFLLVNLFLVIVFLLANFLAFFAVKVVGLISDFAVKVVGLISEYIFNVKKYGICEANKKTVRFILRIFWLVSCL